MYILRSHNINNITVIPRLDRGIQFFQWVLDPPVKPEDDKL
jgi:hypothetical protein